MARAVQRLDQQSTTRASKILLVGDIKEGVLLPGKGKLGQVFGGRRRAHRHGGLAQLTVS